LGSRAEDRPEIGLPEALNALDRDQAFLLEGGVFSAGLIEPWIARERKEEREVRNRPHPYEIELYNGL
jgi:glutamine synthetase